VWLHSRRCVGADLKQGRNQQEDVLAMLEKYPLMNEYWEDKRARITQIQVPAYILASYSTGLHTVGSFRGYEDIASKDKWYDPRRLSRSFLLIGPAQASGPSNSGVARSVHDRMHRGPPALFRPLLERKGQRVGKDATGPRLNTSIQPSESFST
jgi:hypothetical protein